MRAGIESVRGACRAAIARDREKLADAFVDVGYDGFAAVRFLRYLAAMALWDGAGNTWASEEYRASVVADLEAEGSPWAGYFDQGVLNTLVSVLSHQPASGRSIPADQALAALLAVACHQLRSRTDRWATWEQHFNSIVRDFEAVESRAGRV